MKVKEYFKELSDVLNAYTFGDLFEAMQAVELCDQFITENEIPEEELAQIRLLKSLLESIILQGSSDEQEAELLRIKTALLESSKIFRWSLLFSNIFIVNYILKLYKKINYLKYFKNF